MTATAPRAITPGTGDRCVVGVVWGGSVVVRTVVLTGSVVAVVCVAGGLLMILKYVDAVTSWRIAETFTIYSSGLKAVASTSNDQRL